MNGFSHDGGAGDDDNNSTDRHPTLGRREYDLHLQRLLALVCRHAPPPRKGGAAAACEANKGRSNVSKIP